MFYVGQKVVCVDASPGRETGEVHLTKGKIYLIEGFDARRNDDDKPGLLLAGVPHTIFDGPIPVGWDPNRFRPITEKKTDISIFTEMLNPKKVEENV